MSFQKLALALASFAFLLSCNDGQKPATADNSSVISAPQFVRIEAGDDEETILAKATQVRPSERQLRWQQLELTGFIHFGINTFTGREWGDGTEDPKIFNPTELDARQWAQSCKDAGIKQLILTAKHHDGFCLWPSAYTEHSVKNSPWKDGKGDVVKELAEACEELGLGFGVYLSPWDRNAEFFGDSAKYNDYFINQLTELLTNYGPIQEVWFDGANGEGPDGKKQVYDFDRWYNHIRKLQPDAVIAVMGPDVRWVGTETGYGRETEWSVLPGDALLPATIAENSQKLDGFAPTNLMDDDLGSREKINKAKSLVWYPAETDVSIRPGWFYHKEEDSLVKSPEKLLDIYFSSVGRNGVLLLNMPPDTRGLIHENDVRNLREWKQLRDRLFSQNLLKSAEWSGDGLSFAALADGLDNTSWKLEQKQKNYTVEMKFTSPVTTNVFALQENIREGQRVEKFRVEYLKNGEWLKLVEGTTIGYKRLLRFDDVTTNGLRLVIEESRAIPVLSELGAYLHP